jgi:class 3 adenylate cyclase
MEMHRAVIVLADIGGYTRFIKHHGISLIHAEKIITELLESVIASSAHPLILNKLEGDAALFYTRLDADAETAARDVARQVLGFFPAFANKLAELRACNVCVCDACAHLEQLRIKALVHVGDVLFKQVRQFEELAGEPVIVAHRLLKNSVKLEQYVLVTEEFDRLAGGLPGLEGAPMSEDCDGIGAVRTVVYDPVVPAPVQRRYGLRGKLAQFARFQAFFWPRVLRRGPGKGFDRLREL